MAEPTVITSATAMAILCRKTATMVHQPVAVLALIPCCWMLIALSDVAIIAIPFRQLVSWTGKSVGTNAVIPLATTPQQVRARAIGRAISIAARYAPFRSNCYPQALSAIFLARLFRVPTALFFGASFDAESNGRMNALNGHAWVVSGPVTITGGASSFGLFPALGCYVRFT